MRDVLAQDNKLIRSLVQNVKTGNNSSFEQLYQIHAGRVYALCLRLLADKELADETTKNVFLSALKNITFFRADITFGSWLCSIAVYSSLERLRQYNYTVNNISKIKLNNFNLNPFETEILSLPHKERLVFVLHDLEKYTNNETAELTMVKSDEITEYLDRAYNILKSPKTSLSQVTPLNERLNSLANQITPDNDIWKRISTQIHDQKANDNKKGTVEGSAANEEIPDKQEKTRKFNVFGWRKK